MGMANSYSPFLVIVLSSFSLLQLSLCQPEVQRLQQTRLSWATPALQDRGELQTFDGRVIYPSDQTEYDVYRRPWQTFFTFNAYPAIIVQPANAADVVKALTFAKNRNLHVTVRNGGHSYAGLSRSYGMVLDLRLLNSTQVMQDGSNRVTVGAGQINIGMYYALARHDLALPAGGCPSVGISGLTLGGGFGTLSRKLGLTSDQVLELEAVIFNNATGVFESVTVTPSNAYSDLFFAFRGGMGGNYGVVTSWTYQAIPIDRVFANGYNLELDNVRMAVQRGDPMARDNMMLVIQEFMQWCDSTNNDTYCEMSMSTRNVNRTDLSLASATSQQLSKYFELEYVCVCEITDPSCAHCRAEDGRLAQILNTISQTSSFTLYQPPTAEVRRWPMSIWISSGCKSLYDRATQRYPNGLPVDTSIVQECARIPQERIGRGKHNRKKSLFMDPNPTSALLIDVMTWFDDFSSNVIVDNFTAAKIEFHYWGGALSAQPTHRSAWTHRNQKWLIHISGRFSDQADPNTIGIVYHALNGLHRIVAAPFTNGLQDYQNFADASLSYEAWSGFYFDSQTLQELIAINRKYNPHDMFRTELSIPVGSHLVNAATCPANSAAGRITGSVGQYRVLLLVATLLVAALAGIL